MKFLLPAVEIQFSPIHTPKSIVIGKFAIGKPGEQC